MKQTDYVGIDYAGHSNANRNTATGIRYGVIGQNSEGLSPEAVSDIYDGRNLSFEQYQQGAKDALRNALSDYFSDFKGTRDVSRLDIAVQDAFDAIEDSLSDNYTSDCDTYLYEKDGYKIHTSETELWITLSPYYTHAQFCSPCAPGAGNLDTHCPNGPKTYCLGHDWFEDNKAPYPVFSVETGAIVNP